MIYVNGVKIYNIIIILMKKNKYKYRIVLKDDWYYYVQEKKFFIWFDMRPYYDKCISLWKEDCEKWIELIKKIKERKKRWTQIIWYYD